MRYIASPLFILLLLLNQVAAQEVVTESGEKPEENIITYTQNISKVVNELKNLPPEHYAREVDSIRSSIDRFIKFKKGVCQGEFSSIIINERDDTRDFVARNSKKKLSREERKLCYRELKSFQVQFIQSMFQARKKYIIYLHNQQLKDLESSKEEAIQRLNVKFSKKI